MQQSVKSELDRQSTLHNEAENRVREADLSLKTIQAKSKQLTEDLQGQLEQHADAKVGWGGWGWVGGWVCVDRGSAR